MCSKAIKEAHSRMLSFPTTNSSLWCSFLHGIGVKRTFCVKELPQYRWNINQPVISFHILNTSHLYMLYKYINIQKKETRPFLLLWTSIGMPIGFNYYCLLETQHCYEEQSGGRCRKLAWILANRKLLCCLVWLAEWWVGSTMSGNSKTESYILIILDQSLLWWRHNKKSLLVWVLSVFIG